MADLNATLICPQCGRQTVETMPLDRCVFFYECLGCGAVLRPTEGDCCVFCSFADKPCPSKQSSGDCC